MSIKVTKTGRRPGAVFLDDKAAQALALYAKTLISQRTFTRGVGADDRPLPAYTTAYAAKRAKAARRVSPPDYTITGRTRRSIRSVSRRAGSRTRITIGVVGQRAIVAKALSSRGEWMALSPSDKPKFERALRSFIAATRKRQGVA